MFEDASTITSITTTGSATTTTTTTTVAMPAKSTSIYDRSVKVYNDIIS